MATGGHFSRTLESGSEPVYEFPCSLCEDDGKHVEAVKYCEECFVYLCDPCEREKHTKFPLHKRHRLLDQSSFTLVKKPSLVSFPTNRCSQHPGELINIFCGNHDVVCCNVCNALEHRYGGLDCSGPFLGTLIQRTNNCLFVTRILPVKDRTYYGITNGGRADSIYFVRSFAWNNLKFDMRLPCDESECSAQET